MFFFSPSVSSVANGCSPFSTSSSQAVPVPLAFPSLMLQFSSAPGLIREDGSVVGEGKGNVSMYSEDFVNDKYPGY